MRVVRALSIREARAGEERFASAVLSDAAEWLRGRGDALWTPEDVAPAALANEVRTGQYVLALLRDEAVGVARFTREDAQFWPEAVPGEAAYIHRLAVLRSHAGGSVSNAIFDWACARARELGCSFLRLDCDAHRPRLRAVYERFGFEFHSERTVGPHTVARYQKSLALAV